MRIVAFDAGKASTLIQECAAVYRDNLMDRHVLFVPADGSAPFECLFGAGNFQHLCGINYSGNITTTMFFKQALGRRLDPRLLRPAHGVLTVRKLEVLPVLCRIDAKANAAILDPTDHRGTFADLFCLNMDACIGFVRTGDLFRPKTALAFNPPRSEPGYVNIIASVKTEPGSKVFSIISKAPKARARTREKHDAIIRSLSAYPYRERVDVLLDHDF